MPLRIDTPNGQYLLSATQDTPLRLPAVDGQYLFSDTATGLAPETFVTIRIGNDLHVILPDSDILHPDLILEDYYPSDGKSIVGMDSRGQLRLYMPESTEVADSIHLLAENMVAAQSLYDPSEPIAPAINPLAPLVGIVGLAFAATVWTDDRKGRANSPPEQPQTPFIPDRPGDNPSVPGNHTLVPPPGNHLPSPPANHEPIGSVLISGVAQVGKTLTASHTLKDDDGLGTITYKWFASGAEVGTGSTYTVQPQDKGKTLTVKAEYTDGKGHAESVTSAATPAVTDPAPPPAANHPATLTLSGIAKVGQTLTAHLQDDDGLPANPQYQWLADASPIAGATSASYTLTTADIGKKISVKAVFTDNAGHPEDVQSAPSATVLDNPAPPPANETGHVEISGSTREGDTLSATVRDGNGVDPVTIRYQWFAEHVAIPGATAARYRLSANEVGKQIQVRVSYRDNDGYDEALASDFTPAVTGAPAPNHPATLTLSGIAKVGQTLTAHLKDDDGLPADPQYQWLADGSPIAGATAATYTLTAADIGKKISVKAVFTDNAGHAEDVRSAPSNPIADRASARSLDIADAPAVIEGNKLHYRVTLDAPSKAGQSIKFETLFENSRVAADKLAKTADPFKPGEYLGNGTIFTRGVDNMPVAANSKDIVEHTKKMVKNTFGVVSPLNTDAYNIPIYIVDSSDPAQTYATFYSEHGRVNNVPSIVEHAMGRIPLPAHAKPANGSDKSFAVYDKATGMMREYFHAEQQTDGRWKVSSAGFFQGEPGLSELGAKNFLMQLTAGGSSVVMMLNPLSQIGISEVLAGEINHAVSVTLPNSRAGVVSSPAKLTDGDDPSPNAPAMGQWFRIPKMVQDPRHPDDDTKKIPFDPDTYIRNGEPLSPMTRLIVKAVMKYGGYGADRNKNNFAFNAESPFNHIANGKEDPWRQGGEIAQKIGGDPKNINDFPWELVEWAALDWDKPDIDRGVYADTRLTVIVDGVAHKLRPGEDFTLPEGTRELEVQVQTLTHNNLQQTDRVILHGHLIDGGRTLASDDGSGAVQDAPIPIADQQHAPDTDDILVSPNLNPDAIAGLLATPYDDILNYVDQHGHDLLKNVTHPTPTAPILRGGGGDDILISGYGQDYLEGSAGKDLFVYIMDGQNSFPYHTNDTILDFNPAEDRIVLTRGDGWNIQFDRVEFVADAHVQRLQFKVFKGTEGYINAVHIKSHDGHLLSVDEVMNAIIIL